MTVREAVELVLQASALGVRPGDQRGKVLVLDMGQPVKIADLARQMIRLAGQKPDEDIKITYTGLRPGEKLHESFSRRRSSHPLRRRRRKAREIADGGAGTIASGHFGYGFALLQNGTDEVPPQDL